MVDLKPRWSTWEFEVVFFVVNSATLEWMAMRRFYDFFIARFSAVPGDYSMARLIVLFSFTEAIISLIYAALHPLLYFHVPRVLFLGYSLFIILMLFVFSLNISLRIMAHLMIATIWAGFVLGVAYSGGIYSLVLPWVAVMALMANFLIDKKAATAWMFVSVGTLVFFTFYFKDVQVVTTPRSEWRFLMAHIGLVFIVYYFSFLFYEARLRLLREAEERNTRLETQQKHIQEQNQLVENFNLRLRQRVTEIFDRNKLLAHYWNVLLEISKNKAVNLGDFQQALRHITKVVADALNTHRVSIWSFNKEHNNIQCLIIYNALEGRFDSEDELRMNDYPRYFDALKKADVIAADNAVEDALTFEFKSNYLETRNIRSMMDTPYFLDGEIAGVMCCEHTQNLRHWTPEDILFAQALSDIIVLAYRASQRREYEIKLKRQRDEIKEVNESLEQKVRDRTEALQQQNDQLIEYSYINSHLLRGPLSRLLGLIHLIELSDLSANESELVKHLKLSGEELDLVIKKIGQALEKGQFFDRESLRNSE